MESRRKHPPVAIPRNTGGSEPKKLEPARGRTGGLPTAAVVAAMLAISVGSVGLVACGAPETGEVRGDPALRGSRAGVRSHLSDGTAGMAGSSSASAVPPALDPEPKALPGEMAIVIPAPPPSAVPSIGPIRPIRHGGRAISVSPSHPATGKGID